VTGESLDVAAAYGSGTMVRAESFCCSTEVTVYDERPGACGQATVPLSPAQRVTRVCLHRNRPAGPAAGATVTTSVSRQPGEGPKLPTDAGLRGARVC